MSAISFPEIRSSSTACHAVKDMDTAELISMATQGATKRRLYVAYLTTEYPKTSHTFVRREIAGMELLGHQVERFSIRNGGPIVDPADVEEATKTTYLLGQSIINHLWSFLVVVLLRPVQMMKAVRLTFNTWRQSDRSLFRHVAYLVEAATLCRLLKKRGVQHLHVHFGKNAADVARLSYYLGGPTYSMMVHGPGEFDSPQAIDLGGKVEDSLFTTAITSYAKAQLQRWTNYRHWSKLHIVRCTINEAFLNAGRPLADETNQFVCIGRLTAQKGQLLLVDAVAALIKKRVKLKLVLAGDGEMRTAIEDRIRYHQIEDSVEITGWIGEQRIRELLLESRAMVLPSFAEGLPVAIMEAFALGRTVICSAITGIPELVSHGHNGWLVIPGCAADLANAMRECLETPINVLNAMGASGKERVRQNHLSSTEAKRLSQIMIDSLQDFPICSAMDKGSEN